MNSQNKTVLRVKDLIVRYKDSKKPIVNGLTINIKQGEVVAIMGKSGVGKTTLLKSLLPNVADSDENIDFVVEGSVKHSNYTSIVSVVDQSATLFPWLTLFENILLGLDNVDIIKSQKYSRVHEVMKNLNLSGFHDALPEKVSGGMRQRACIARALVSRPSILFMDEPFSALDPVITDDIWEDLLDLGVTILLVSHDIEQAAIYADTVILMSTSNTQIMNIDISRPRYSFQDQIDSVIDKIYNFITSSSKSETEVSIFGPLKECAVEVSIVLGLLGEIEEMSSRKESFDLLDLSDYAKLSDSSDIIEAVNLLRVFQLISIDKDGNIDITSDGSEVLRDDHQEQILANALYSHIPFIRILFEYLEKHKLESISNSHIVRILVRQHGISRDTANKTLSRIIEWGRYSRVLSYDDLSQMVYFNKRW